METNKKIKKIKNITSLRVDLLEMYEDMRARKVNVKEAKANALVANTIVSTARVQMEYKEMTKSNGKISFLES